MFLDDLKKCMNGCTDLNTYFKSGGGIRYLKIPDNWLNSSNNWIRYSYNRIDSEDSSDAKDIVSHYSLELIIISQNIITVSEMFQLLNTYLDTYDDGNIRDVSLSSGGDDYDFADDIQMYYCMATYDILYFK